MVINRFRQLKEEEKKNRAAKALPAEEAQASASDYDSEDGSDEGDNNKVK